MKNISINWFSRQLETKSKANGQLETNESKKKSDDPELWRDILAYWILGLTTEFGYVVIICAAHDILHGFYQNSNNGNATDSHSTVDVEKNRQNVCDAPSTGVLLLADIVPSVVMNIMCPFLPLFQNVRIALVIALNVSSFLLIAHTQADYLAIIGVVFTSLALGISEVTLLSYSAKFNKKVIAAWSSGTGSAGIIGSISWAGLIALGISPRDTLQIMLIVPAIQAATFWFLLRYPTNQVISTSKGDLEANSCTPDCVLPDLENKLNSLKAKLKFVPKLATFITPLVIVFIFEYICVSGLFEMIYVHDSWLSPQSQYRWFLVSYQIGVFSSRTLGTFIKPHRTWWASVVQCLNACCFTYLSSAAHQFNAWIIFIFVFELGAIGGICYVHTFQRLIQELPPNKHKFSLGMITIAESVGIAIGGSSAIPIHNILCGKSILS